ARPGWPLAADTAARAVHSRSRRRPYTPPACRHITGGDPTCLDMHGLTRYGVRIPARARRRPCDRAARPRSPLPKGAAAGRTTHPPRTEDAGVGPSRGRPPASGRRHEMRRSRVRITSMVGGAAVGLVAALTIASVATAQDDTELPSATGANEYLTVEVV